ncbi:MAG: YqgE/AlgH family protein [Betaproteobacteria bacterium]
MRASLLTVILCAAILSLAPDRARAQTETEHAFLLVATPGMLDSNFAGTVVLAMRSDDGGPLGVILNRPTTTELRSLYPEHAELAERDDLIFLGGPVQPDALLFAFRSAKKPAKGMFVAEDIYISGFSEIFADILKHPENADEQRFFSGYAGWVAGQLEAEIAHGGWYVLPFDARVLFGMNPLTMYQDLLERASAPRIEARHSQHLTRVVTP